MPSRLVLIDNKPTNKMVLALAVPPLALFIVFYFLRSTPEMPKNWREFMHEINIQATGSLGLVEDLLMKLRNKVGE